MIHFQQKNCDTRKETGKDDSYNGKAAETAFERFQMSDCAHKDSKQLLKICPKN